MDNILEYIKKPDYKHVDKKVSSNIKSSQKESYQKKEKKNAEKEKQTISAFFKDIYDKIYSDYLEVINIYIKRAEMAGESIYIKDFPSDLRSVLNTKKDYLYPREFLNLIVQYINLSATLAIYSPKSSISPKIEKLLHYIVNSGIEPNMAIAAATAIDLSDANLNGQLLSDPSVAFNSTDKTKSTLLDIAKNCMGNCYSLFSFYSKMTIGEIFNKLIMDPVFSIPFKKLMLDIKNLIDIKLDLMRSNSYIKDVCSLVSSYKDSFENMKCIPDIYPILMYANIMISRTRKLINAKLKTDVSFKGLAQISIRTAISATTALVSSLIIHFVSPLQMVLDCLELDIVKQLRTLQRDYGISIDTLNNTESLIENEDVTIVRKVNFLRTSKNSIEGLRSEIDKSINKIVDSVSNEVHLSLSSKFDEDKSGKMPVPNKGMNLSELYLVLDNWIAVAGVLSDLINMKTSMSEYLKNHGSLKDYSLKDLCNKYTKSWNSMQELPQEEYDKIRKWINSEFSTKSTNEKNDKPVNSNIETNAEDGMNIVIVDSSLSEDFLSGSIDSDLENSYYLNEIINKIGGEEYSSFFKEYLSSINNIKNINNVINNDSSDIISSVQRINMYSMCK